MESFRERAAEQMRDQKLREYLREYLGPEAGDLFERVRLDSVESLSSDERLRSQLEVFEPSLLRRVRVAVVPDEDWFKGEQPSESHADQGLVLVREGHLEEGDSDAWLTHELGHCESHDGDPEGYGPGMETRAYDDLPGDETYPNNLVERHAFGRQFEFLKSAGYSRQDIEEIVDRHYGQEDRPFFDRLLDEAYG